MRALTVGLEHKQSAESAHPTPPSPRVRQFHLPRAVLGVFSGHSHHGHHGSMVNRCACIFATSVAPMPKLEESPQRTAPRRGAARVGMGVGEKTKPEARAGRKESVIVASAYRIRPAERPLARARWTRKLSAVRAAQVRMAGASDRMAGAEARRPACSTMAGARRGLEEPEDISFAHLS